MLKSTLQNHFNQGDILDMKWGGKPLNSKKCSKKKSHLKALSNRRFKISFQYNEWSIIEGIFCQFYINPSHYKIKKLTI